MQWLDFFKAKKLLEKYGINFAESVLVKNKGELKNVKIEFPWAMKVYGKILHKTEAGGVKVDIGNLEEAEDAFLKMKNIPGSEGVIVQRMYKGIELIIGCKEDAQFGKIILFGLGGIMTEIFKDVSIRALPISRYDAKKMIREIKGFKILNGFRNLKPVNLKLLEEYLLRVSHLMQKENISEMDINPIIAYDNKLIAVDVRIKS